MGFFDFWNKEREFTVYIYMADGRKYSVEVLCKTNSEYDSLIRTLDLFQVSGKTLKIKDKYGNTKTISGSVKEISY